VEVYVLCECIYEFRFKDSPVLYCKREPDKLSKCYKEVNGFLLYNIEETETKSFPAAENE